MSVNMEPARRPPLPLSVLIRAVHSDSVRPSCSGAEWDVTREQAIPQRMHGSGSQLAATVAAEWRDGSVRVRVNMRGVCRKTVPRK
jgi:hypothetical protein